MVRYLSGVEVTELPSLHIGEIKLDFPVIQAALSGYSDWPMRRMARRLGASFTIAEVMLDQFVLNVSKGNKANRYVHIDDDEHPVGAQLMGGESEELVPAAQKLVDVGFDVIDINIACPVKKVLGKHRGGFLLSQPNIAIDIIKKVRDALPPNIPVTVKMRRGFDDSAQSYDNFFIIFDSAFDIGVDAITVHGRTVRQRYEGRACWDFIREVKKHAESKTVLGSGDLFTAQACIAMLHQTGVDGVTAARGAIGNPWIFQQARDLSASRPIHLPSLHQQRDVIFQHWQWAAELYGSHRACRVMRKFGIKYANSHPQPEEVKAAFVAVSSPNQWMGVLQEWYNEEDLDPTLDSRGCINS